MICMIYIFYKSWFDDIKPISSKDVLPERNPLQCKAKIA